MKVTNKSNLIIFGLKEQNQQDSAQNKFISASTAVEM